MELEKVLVFDCETTGLPEKGQDYKVDYAKFPNVVQLAWFINGQYKNYIIKPEGWVIPPEATEIHGITQERAEAEGVPFITVMDEFIFDCSEAKKVVGHNVYFDSSMIKANILKLGMPFFFQQVVEPVLDKDRRVCTMMKTIKFVGAQFPDGRKNKYPKLEELYFKLFNEEFPAHNALEDVKAVMRCLPELVKEGLVEL